MQKIRKAALVAAVLALVALAVFNQAPGGLEGAWHESVEPVGLAAIIVAIVGRAWCSLYIGGRKKAEIVDRGPYSLTRNPLYIFSFIGAFGMGCQTGSVTIGLLFVLATLGVFALTVAREEAFLAATFGQTYANYVARTPRFWPRFSLWRDEPELTVRPAFFLLTLRDGLVFLLAMPLFEAIDMAQGSGWLKVLTNLP